LSQKSWFSENPIIISRDIMSQLIDDYPEVPKIQSTSKVCKDACRHAFLQNDEVLNVISRNERGNKL
jgi:hypothetical protein